MLKKTQQKDMGIIMLTLMFTVIVLSVYVVGDPTGAALTNLSTSQKAATTPDFGNHSKGAILTIRLGATQQDTKWKAYVGNVTSAFVLDDADDYSIYQWTINSFTGQVYITRNSSVTWSNVGCAVAANKETEDTTNSHTSTAEDSLNSTFVLQAHKQFYVGATDITANNCFSIATNINDTAQTPSGTQPFTEVLLWDSDGKMIYTTFVESDVSGYRNVTGQDTYDFQAIVPESGSAGDPAFTYYFYLELTSS